MFSRNERSDAPPQQRQTASRQPPPSLTLRGKKDVMSTDRLNVSPSPIKKADISQNRAQGKLEVSQVPEALHDNFEDMGSHKIMIRQFELVEFTKKFAIQKADYEDRIEALMHQRDSLKHAMSRLEADLRKATQLLSGRDHQQAQEATKNQKLIQELQIAKARLEGELTAVRTESNQLHAQVGSLTKQTEGLMKMLSAQRLKNNDLDRIKLSMIDSNNKLSDENHQLVLATKTLEDSLANARSQLKVQTRTCHQLNGCLIVKDEEVNQLKEAASMTEQNLKSKTMEFEIACMKVIMLGAAMEFEYRRRQPPKRNYSSPEQSIHNQSLSMRSLEDELRMSLNIMQIESEHARQQFLLQKERLLVNQSHLQEENYKLNEELRQKSKRIFELSLQAPQVKPAVMQSSGIELRESKKAELNTSVSGRLFSSRNCVKCLQCQSALNVRRSRDNVENTSINNCSPTKMSLSIDRELASLRGRNECLERELMEARTYIEELETHRQEIAEQYEYLKAQLTEHLAVKCQNKRIVAKSKMMEEVISALKGENQELKEINYHIDQQHSHRMQQSMNKELREIVFAYERERLNNNEDIHRLQQQVRQLKHELVGETQHCFHNH